MSATRVPEARAPRDQPFTALRGAGFFDLTQDSLVRFTAADGFAHVRSVAFQITLTALPLFIAAVGFTTALGDGAVRDALKDTMLGLTPGKTSQTVTQAFKQGSQAGSGSSMALWFGLIAALASATTAMVYVERGANRIYGIDEDRPLKERYLRALLIAISSGLLLILAFVLFMAGSSLGKVVGPESMWAFIRWPVAAAALVAGFVLVLRLAPHRDQPPIGWLWVGGLFGTTLWALFTGALALYLGLSRSFGQTYGPLAGVIGMLFWAFLSALAIFLAFSFAAQLEAERAGGKPPAKKS